MRWPKRRLRFEGLFSSLHCRSILLSALAVCFGLTAFEGLATAAAAAGQMPMWNVPYIPGPVKIDGKLDDPAYARAFRWDNFVQIDPGDNTSPSRKSVLFLFTTDDALIIGLRCFDSHPEEIRRTRYRRDQGADEDVEILLDAFGTAKQAYYLAVTPMNDITDGTDDLASSHLSTDFDMVFDHAAVIDRKGWSAEVRIPFRSINYLEKGGVGSWYLWLNRSIPRKFSETDSAVPSSRSSSDPLDGFARITVTHVPAARAQAHWRAIPSEVVSHVDTRTREGAGPSTSGVSTQGAFGFTGEWVPSSGTSLKGTINPDFSQVEADDTYQRINNRYPVFFSEKRPFFMDGMESFSTPIDLLDTRNIVKPELGVKLSTKGKRLGLYGISALEQDVPAERFGLSGGPRDTWWHVLRATWGTRPKGSFIGAMVTERDFGSDFNRVISIDGVQRFGRLTATYQGAISQTGSEGDTDSGNGGSLALNYKWNRYFTTSIYYDVLSPGFRADSGFLARVDYRSYQLVQDFYYRPRSSKPVIKSLTVDTGYEVRDNYRSVRIDSMPWWTVALILQHQLVWVAQYWKDDEWYLDRSYPTDRFYARCGWSEHARFQPRLIYSTGHSILYGTDPHLVNQKTFSWGLDSSWGPLTLTVSADDYTYRERHSDTLDRSQRSYEAVARYVFSDHVNFKVFYIHERASFYDLGFHNPYDYVNLLFTWRKNAFTRLYVGLTHSRDLDQGLDWAPLSSQRQTIAFAKITWLFD